MRNSTNGSYGARVTDTLKLKMASSYIRDIVGTGPDQFGKSFRWLARYAGHSCRWWCTASHFPDSRAQAQIKFTLHDYLMVQCVYSMLELGAQHRKALLDIMVSMQEARVNLDTQIAAFVAEVSKER